MRIKKIFKSIFILFVLVLFNINSFAAISVADGSAFVTKAEFQADITNMSDRMSQLENSLDAKIDSLVSAYLSRNGIWNAYIQDISENNTKFKYQETGTYKGYYLFEDGNTTGKRYYNTSCDTGYSNSLFTWLKTFIKESSSSAAVRNSSDFMPYLLLVNKVTKSGLCNLVLDLSSTDSDSRLGCSMLFEPTTTYKSYAYYPKITVDFVIYVQTGTNYVEVGRIPISSENVTWADASSRTKFTTNSNFFRGITQSYFFVSKEDKIHLRPEFLFNTTASRAAECLTAGKVSGAAGSGSLYYRYAIKASVY